VIRVGDTEQMKAAVLERAGNCDVIIMCAAVADFKPRAGAGAKLPKEQHEGLTLELVRTPDILAELGRLPEPRPLLVGFAAEDRDLESRARAKLERKRIDLMVANDVSRSDLGADAVDNEVVLLEPGAEPLRLARACKAEVAAGILDRVVAMMGARK
jgi:phosphopantothenoylcysteine decarboxylase/phosphopantothenate--cysteine ligase